MSKDEAIRLLRWAKPLAQVPFNKQIRESLETTDIEVLRNLMEVLGSNYVMDVWVRATAGVTFSEVVLLKMRVEAYLAQKDEVITDPEVIPSFLDLRVWSDF
jgi:hypothetical protein